MEIRNAEFGVWSLKFRAPNSKLLISLIEAPGKFIVQGLKEIVLAKADQVHHKALLPDGELNVLAHDLAAAVEGADHLFGPAFQFKRYDIAVGHYDRPHIKVVRCNGCNKQAA